MKMVYLLPLLLVGACGGTSQDQPDQETSATPSEREAESGLAVLNSEGVWLFTYDAGGVSLDALHSGETAIVSDCLVVRDAVVAWPTSRVNEALAYVDEVKLGIHRDLQLGGAGLSLDEAGRLPSIVTEKCGADTIWYAAPKR